VLRSNLGAWGAGGVVVAGLLLSTIATFAASPDQLYQTWQKNFLTDPAVSEKAAEDYLRAAPQGPHAQDIRVWLAAYQKAVANLLMQSRNASPTVAQNAPQNAPKQAPANTQAAAKPAQQAPQPKPQPSPAVKLATAPPAPPKPAPAQTVVQDLKVWLDASRKAIANLVTQSRKAGQTVAQNAAKNAPKQAPANKQAAAKPAQQAPQPTPQPSPAVKLATAQPPKSAPAVGQAAAPPAPPKPASPKPAPAQQVAHAAPPAAKQPETRTASAMARDNPARGNESSNTAPARPPAVKPPGQTVDDMLAFIADKVESEDRLNFTAVFINAAGGELVERLSYDASNVTIDPNRCQLSYRWHVVQDGKGMPDQDRAVQFRLTKGITVETIDRALGDLNDNHFTVHAAPQAYAVHIARWDKPSGDNLYFRDREMAETVAGAAQQALELCDKASARFGN
jgi:hypothetical protein